jgi:hypothetical protein
MKKKGGRIYRDIETVGDLRSALEGIEDSALVLISPPHKSTSFREIVKAQYHNSTSGDGVVLLYTVEEE